MTRLTHTFLAICLLWSAIAHAHKPSDSYLVLDAAFDQAQGSGQPLGGQQLSGQWDIALRDLEQVVGIDRDGNGAITWGELRERKTAIEQYAFAHLSVSSRTAGSSDACPITFDELLVDEHVDGAYAVLRFKAACPTTPTDLAIRYSLLFHIDPNHRGLLDLRTAHGSQAIVLSRDDPEFIAVLGSTQHWRSALRSFVRDGVLHILHGYDHILFLVTLLLPAVVLYRRGGWEARASLRDAMLDVIKVVSAFTLAHSLTLSIAVLGYVRLPSRFVESAIAFTVILGALNNLRPVVTQRRWLAAFAFGLIHGFGFASVLADLGLQGADLALALLGFNLGVEVGQLAIVTVLVPLAYGLRTSMFYRRVFMPGGAVLIFGLASYWFVERAFEVTARS